VPLLIPVGTIHEILELVLQNELTNHEAEGTEQFTVPDQSEIISARSVGQVVPDDIGKSQCGTRQS
jgi:hypothetical protein